MGFWSWLTGTGEGVTPNTNGPDTHTPGDADGVELLGEETFSRANPFPVASPWSGWPAEWNTPAWGGQIGLNKLVDTAWACLDLNSSILSAMPVYRMQSGQIVSPMTWMTNPDPMIYTSWQEFAKQLFWDYQMGEAFVLPMAHRADGFPMQFRVVPPWLMNVELTGGGRRYTLGYQDVTADVLHIRYQSSTTDARGHGPLEAAGARMTAAGLLQKYANRIAETGGTPLYWMEVDRRLNETEANDLLDRWVQSRARRAGEPALVSGGAKLHPGQSMSAKDMTLLELAQFNESRIAVLLGVPPFLAGLPGPGGLTYANESQLFDFHDRSSLRPKATAVMSALSGWALPRGQTAELNRDEYSRPDFAARANAWKIYLEAGVVDAQFVAKAERFDGGKASGALTGLTDAAGTSPTQDAIPPSGGNP